MNEFRIEHEGELPATPAQVWDAVTRDTDAWLMPATDLSGSRVLWEPPHHGIIRMEQGPWFNQLEYRIEENSNGSYLRYVHSGVFVDDWENQYDGARRHTEFYMHTLGQYLRYFAGQPFQHVEVYAPVESIHPDGLNPVRQAIGITQNTPAGTELSIEVPGIGDTNAVLDFHNEYFIGLRTDDALYRVFGRNHFGAPVAIGAYHYGDDKAFDRTGANWEGWLAKRYPS